MKRTVVKVGMSVERRQDRRRFVTVFAVSRAWASIVITLHLHPFCSPSFHTQNALTSQHAKDTSNPGVTCTLLGGPCLPTNCSPSCPRQLEAEALPRPESLPNGHLTPGVGYSLIYKTKTWRLEVAQDCNPFFPSHPDAKDKVNRETRAATMPTTRSGKQLDNTTRVTKPRRDKKTSPKPKDTQTADPGPSTPSSTSPTLFFWRETDPRTGWLSQWYPCAFTDSDGVVYKTAEQFVPPPLLHLGTQDR